jgi:hypothetical protein
MGQAIPIMWKCSECSLEYENEDEAKECCDDIQDADEIVSEEAEVEGNEDEIDESDDDEDDDEVE